MPQNSGNVDAETLAMLQALVEEVQSKKRRDIDVTITLTTDREPDTTFERARDAYAIARETYQEVYTAIGVVRQRFPNATMAEQADTIYALRETLKLLHDLHKEVNKVYDLAQRTLCDAWSRRPPTDESDVIRATHCSAWPSEEVKVGVPTPEKSPEAYAALWEWLRLPEDLKDRGKELWADGGELRTKVVEVNYLGLNDLIKKLGITGYAVPNFLETWFEATVTVRKCKDLL